MPRQAQAGFTLIEVLVATVVIAVALLGGAVALLDAIRAQRDGRNRTLAALLASDLAERITANPAAAAAYALSPEEVPAEPETGCDQPQSCAPADLALSDVHDWHATLQRALPGSAAEIDVTPGAMPGSFRYSIRLEWVEASASDPVSMTRTIHR